VDIVPEDIVDILYSCIDEIGRERIRTEITSDIAASKKFCKEIIGRCRSKLGPGLDDETLATICEATLHFMLTVSLLPSERKVNVRGMDLDIVIPSQRMLGRQPEKTLVVQVIKKSNDIAKVRQAESVQPKHANIWTVSAKPVQTGHKNYHLDSEKFSYIDLISDINLFLLDSGVRGLKLLHGH
jgi:hypothetical protein